MKTLGKIFLALVVFAALFVIYGYGANTTIKDLPTTSVLPATNDYTVSDGATGGTRKILLTRFTYLTATRATLTALSITNAADGIGISVLGATAAGDGGGGTYYWNASSTATPNGNTVLQPDSLPGTGRWLKATGGVSAPGPATLGGVFSNSGASHQWISAINTDGTVTLSQPAASDVSGLGSMATQNSNSVSILGGTIDGAAIGNTTPAAGTFTTLVAQNSINLGNGSAASTRTITINGGTNTNVGSLLDFQRGGTLGARIGSSGAAVGDSGADLAIWAASTRSIKFFANGATSPDATLSSSGLSLLAPLSGASGGTGVNNSGKTITLGGNFTTSGGFNLTFTLSGATSVTLPTTGTLATLTGTEALANKTITASAFNGTVGATTPSTGAFTNVTGSVFTRTGTATNNAVWGVVSDATTYNALTLNNVSSSAGMLGISGGGGSDAALYFRAPTGGSFPFVINGATVGSVTFTGLNGMPIGTTTPSTVKGTVFSPDAAGSANLRSSKVNFNVIVNVRDYGAVGDGTTNDTSAVQAARTAAVSAHGAIYFPASSGAYMVDVGALTITGANGLAIFGDGKGSSIVKARNPSQVINVSSSSRVNIWGLTIDGSCTVRTAGQHAVVFNASQSTITDCEILNSGEFSILAGSGSSAITDLTVSRVSIRNGYADGINLQFVDGAVIAENQVNADDDLVAIGYNGSGAARNVVVVGNRLRARTDLATTWGRGIWVGQGVQNCLIEGNYVQAVKQTGIYLNGAASARIVKVQVKNNYLYDCARNSGHGIAAYSTSDSTLEGNIVDIVGSVSGSANCIDIADWTDLVIKGGRLQASQAGIFSRGIHADEGGGWTNTSWLALEISDVTIRMTGSGTNSCIYLSPTSGISMGTGAISGIRGAQIVGGDYIYVNNSRVSGTWKLGNNVALTSNTVSSGAGLTLFNNN